MLGPDQDAIGGNDGRIVEHSPILERHSQKFRIPAADDHVAVRPDGADKLLVAFLGVVDIGRGAESADRRKGDERIKSECIRPDDRKKESADPEEEEKKIQKDICLDEAHRWRTLPLSRVD